MAVLFDQSKYIETSKGIIKEFTKTLLPDYDYPAGLPDIGNDQFSLERPLIHIEFNNSSWIDSRSGRNNGRGKRVKRKLLRYSFQVITTGENSAVLERDRISQTIEYEFTRTVNHELLASKGLKDIDMRYMNSYRVREGVHLARLELFTTITMVN